MSENRLYQATAVTPIGDLLLVGTQKALCLVDFVDSERLSVRIKKIKQHFDRNPLSESSVVLEQAKAELNCYFQGGLQQFSVALLTIGTPFQKKVWEELTKIEYGHTDSYLRQASAVMKPKALRAVANAVAQNDILIFIPCHRVVGSNGSLSGYSGGLWRKRWLLSHEAHYSK